MYSALYSSLVFCGIVELAAAFGPWVSYQTEPTFRSSIFTIRNDVDRSATSPGYIFITNYISDDKSPSFGPQIYTLDGDLVWNGNSTVHVRALDLHVCDYNGERGTHLCYNDAIPSEQAGHSSGTIRFFDSSYEQVGDDFAGAGDLRGPDSHELNTPHFGDSTTFLQDIYQPRDRDLSGFKGAADGHVLDGCFQEIDQASKGVLFQWCALDHVDLSETLVYLNNNPDNYSTWIAGDGSKGRPWDWFHINSADKNEEGDYVVSGRHTDTIYKVAGNQNNLGLAPGQIMWRLGGKNTDFQLDGFNFSRQHNVRFYETRNTESLISIFNNADDGSHFTQKWSEGLLISMNNVSMTAHIHAHYESPDRKRSFSQGSVQFTDHNTTFIGWGNRPFVSEHDNNGTLLYYSEFSGHVESYRAWKFPWIGTPKSSAKLLGYCLDVNSPLYAYISWNGATEVTAWRFWASQESTSGPWTAMGDVPKKGFETFVNFTAIAVARGGSQTDGKFQHFIYAEALDAAGRVIGISNIAETFIPDANTTQAYKCNETQCQRCANMTDQACDNAKFWFEYGAEHSQAWMVERQHKAGYAAAAVLVVAHELLLLVGGAWLCRLGMGKGKAMGKSEMVVVGGEVAVVRTIGDKDTGVGYEVVGGGVSAVDEEGWWERVLEIVKGKKARVSQEEEEEVMGGLLERSGPSEG